ncbi:YqgE/AlgH family protein [uncultured Litoreibacter sp.]|uniref:YqgE/AlgH family protein n=1 Tax=uncultured Litoreibacter sp. TaxID=1392394 RepID=UPI00261CC05B|nr:YqgE/AlgH family protein [uncultured Litoreibacter sp.]
MDLNGRLLIAMPSMGDQRFEQSVIFICSHSDKGAMGLIVNKPAEDLKFKDLLKQLEIEAPPSARSIRIHVGGPVEFGRGFVLHSSDYDQSEATLKVGNSFGMTATLDILEDIAMGDGPDLALLAMGYAGWGPGQLEDEIVRNGWLIGDASEALVFGKEDSGKWQGALKAMGIDPLLLSAEGGRA